MSDIVTQVYPWRTFARTSLRHGEIPLWNPYILSGTPFQANGQSALFYPLNWVFHILPMPIAWTVSLVLKIALIGIFTFLFARAIGCSTLAAMSSGVVLAMSGFFWCWLAWPVADAALWLPLICYAVYRLYHTGHGAILAGFSYAMPVLAGQAEIAFYVVSATTLFALYLCLARPNPAEEHISTRRFLVLFLAASLVAVGIAAIQLFPTIEWLRFTNRSLSDLWGPLRFKEALAFFSRDISHNPNISGIRIPVQAAYAGGMTLIAAPIAWFFPNRRLTIWFVIILLLSFACVYGIKPISSLSLATPVLQGAKKEQMLLIIEFALAMLCGMGLTVLEEHAQVRKRRVLCVSLVVFVFALPCILLLGHGGGGHTKWWRVPNSIIPFLLAALLLIGLRAVEKISRRRFALGALILLVIDLGSYAYGYIPFVSLNKIYPSVPVFDFLRQQPPPFRVLSLDHSAGINFESMYQLPAPGGYDIMLRRITRLTWELTSGEGSAVTFQTDRLIATPNRVIDMLNVRYLVISKNSESIPWFLAQPGRFKQVFSDGNVLVFENQQFIDFGIVVPMDGIEMLQDESVQLARVTSASFDPHHQVVLSQAPAGLAQAHLTSTGRRSRMISYQRSANSFSLGIETPFAGILVVSEMHFPGWHVYVDGEEQQLLRANYAFMGVAVKRGEHEVRFEFHPAIFYWGLEISVITIGVLAIVGFTQRKSFPAWKRRALLVAAIGIAACLIVGLTFRFVSRQTKEIFDERIPPAERLSTGRARTGYFTVACKSGKPPQIHVIMDFLKDQQPPFDLPIYPMTTYATANIKKIPWNQIGIAVANPGSSETSIALEIDTQAGSRIFHSTIKLPPGHQISKFLAEVSPDLQSKAPATLSLRSRAPFSLFMAQVSNTIFHPIPYEIHEPQSGPLMFPEFLLGGGWNTEVFLTNSADEAATGLVEFYAPDHSPFDVKSQGIRKHIIEYYIQPGGTLHISPGPY